MTQEQQAFLEEFVKGYMVCAIWSAPGEEDSGELDAYSIHDFAPEVAEAIRAECADFVAANWEDLQQYEAALFRVHGGRNSGGDGGSAAEYAGHDFSLTRNGHGAGFWDRGLGELGDRLSKAAEVYGTACAYVGDDGKLYMHG